MTDRNTPTPDVAPPSPSAWLITVRVLVVMAIVLFGQRAMLTTFRAQAAIQAGRVQLDNEEGALLYQAYELQKGHLPYRPLSAPPWVVGTYPPVYMLLTAAVSASSEPSFSGGRVITMLSALGAAAALAWLAYLFRGQRTLGMAVAPLMFLGSFECFRWCAYVRVDLTAIFFALLGLAVFLHGRQRVGWQVAAAVLMATGFFTKQTVLAAPLASVMIAWLNGWRPVRWVGILAMAFGLPFAVLLIVTDGEFYRHTVQYNINTFRLSELRVWSGHVARVYPFLLPSVAVGGAAIFWLRPRWQTAADTTEPASRAPLHHVLLYAVPAWATFVTIGKAGTAENYILEPMAAAALVMATAVSGPWTQGKRSAAARLAVAGGLVLQAGWLCVGPLAPGLYSPMGSPTSTDNVATSEVVRQVRANAGSVFCEFAGFQLLAGQPPLLQPFIMSELARQGKWDESAFLTLLKTQKLTLLVLNRPIEEPGLVFTPAMVEAIAKNYTPAGQIQGRVFTAYLYRALRTQ